MRIDFLTLFPEMCETVMSESIIGRARKKGAVEVCFHQIRDFAFDKHNRVDDCPFGGGKGMLMMAEPIALCIEDVVSQLDKKPHIIYMSPWGKVLDQKRAKELSELDDIVILCGHYEGVDERVLETFVDEYLSIGDYVLTGGELPGLVLADAVCRMLPGVLADDACFEEESHYNGVLEHPHYTRPANWRGQEVPPVLLSGHHANIEKWRREESLRRTAKFRPDLLETAPLTEKDKVFLEELEKTDGFNGL
jgi:tRNA (guanine37-N1)-methyltransferase